MQAIKGLKCVYLLATQSWAIEFAVEGESEVKRIPIPGPEHVETFLDAFDQSTESWFDPAAKEVVFDFQYTGLDDDEFDDDEVIDDEDEEDDEDEAASKKEKQ